MTRYPLRPVAPEQRYWRRRANRRVRKVRLARTALRVAALVVLQLLGLAALLFLARRAFDGLRESPLLALRTIEIDGVERTGEATIRRALDPWLGRNVLDLDLAVARAAVEACPWVGVAALKVVLPGTLRVQLVERAPGALTVIAGRAHLVDAAGRVLGPAGPGLTGDLPVLRGAEGLEGPALDLALARGVRAFSRLEAVAPALGREISELDVGAPDRIVARTSGPGPRLVLDPRDVERNVGRWLELRAALEHSAGPVDYVDLRWDDRIAVMPLAR